MTGTNTVQEELRINSLFPLGEPRLLPMPAEDVVQTCIGNCMVHITNVVVTSSYQGTDELKKLTDMLMDLSSCLRNEQEYEEDYGNDTEEQDEEEQEEI